MQTMLAYTRFEALRLLRNLRFLTVTMLMPAFLFELSSQARSGHGPYLLVAVAGFSMITATTSANTVALPAERASGWQRQLRITPLSGPSWVTARLLLSTVTMLPGLAVVAVSAATLGGVQLSPVQWASFAALVVGASVPFSFLGLLLGQLLDAQAAQPVQGLLMMLLSVGGGLLLPLSSFPPALRYAAGVLPSHLYFENGQAVLADRAPQLSDMAGIGLWAVALGVLALLVWLREDGRRVALGGS
jgi:ABC-2 type transport system permease protein